MMASFNRVFLRTVIGLWVVTRAMGCSRDVLTPPNSSLDQVPPRIIFSSPAANADAVSVAEPLRLEFSERMNRSSVKVSVTPTLSFSEPKWGAIEDGEVVSLSTTAPWEKGTSYSISVSGSDLAENALAAASFSFKIAATPPAPNPCDSNPCQAGCPNSDSCLPACDSQNCPNGCCQNGLCYTFEGLPDGSQKTSAERCGTGGEACRASTDFRADRCSATGALVCGGKPLATACTGIDKPYCDPTLEECTCHTGSSSCRSVLGLAGKSPDVCCPSNSWCSICSTDQNDLVCGNFDQDSIPCSGGGAYRSAQVP